MGGHTGTDLPTRGEDSARETGPPDEELVPGSPKALDASLRRSLSGWRGELATALAGATLGAVTLEPIGLALGALAGLLFGGYVFGWRRREDGQGAGSSQPGTSAPAAAGGGEAASTDSRSFVEPEAPPPSPPPGTGRGSGAHRGQAG